MKYFTEQEESRLDPSHHSSDYTGHYGMMPGFGQGGMMGGGLGMMMPLQPFVWTAIVVISALSIGMGAILIIDGYLIYRNPEVQTNGE